MMSVCFINNKSHDYFGTISAGFYPYPAEGLSDSASQISADFCSSILVSSSRRLTKFWWL